MDIRQIIREELLKIESKEKPFMNNYGLPDWFNLLDQYRELEKKNNFSEQKLNELVLLMNANIPDCRMRMKEYHKIIFDWDVNSF